MEDKVWVGTFREVAAYTKAAAGTTLSFKERGRKVIIEPSTDLDPELYGGLLTMEMPCTDMGIQAQQDKKDLAVTCKDGKAYFSFDPFGGEITVSQQPL